MKMLFYNLYLPWNVLEINMDWCLSRRYNSNTVSSMVTHSRNHAAEHHIEIMYVTLEFFEKRPKLRQPRSVCQDGAQTCYHELHHFCSCFFASGLVVFPCPQWWVCCAVYHRLCFEFSLKRAFSTWKASRFCFTWPKVSVVSGLLVPKLSNKH